MMPYHMGQSPKDASSSCCICGKYAKWQCDYQGCHKLICQIHATPEFESDTDAFNRGDNKDFFTLCPEHKVHQIRTT